MQSTHPQLFSDAPQLHANAFAGALQLIVWLFCHPSAWRNHVTRVDASLRPDFALLELRRAHWRNPELRHLLWLAVCVVPVLMSAWLANTLWMVGLPADILVFAVVLCLSLSLSLSALAGVAYGLACSVAFGFVLSSVYASAALLNVLPAGAWTGSEPVVVMLCLPLGIVGSMAGVFGGPQRRAAYSWQRKAVAVTLGALLGTLLFVTLVVVAQTGGSGEREYVALGILIGAAGLLAGSAIGLRSGRRRGTLVGLASLIGLPLLFAALWLAGSALEQALGEAESAATWFVVFGPALCVFVSLLYVLSAGLTGRMAGAAAGGLAGALASGLGLVIAFGLLDDLTWIVQSVANGFSPESVLRAIGGFFNLRSLGQPTLLAVGATLVGWSLNVWRPLVAYPFELLWNGVLRRADEQRVDGSAPARLALAHHSAFWDEWQRLPLFGLDRHIVAIGERDRATAQATIAYLSVHRQHWAAQAAQIELDARQLERRVDAAAIAAGRESGAGELSGSDGAVLRSFGRISQDVDAALRQESAYNRRLALSAAGDKLDALVRELTRSDVRYAARFRPIAAQWSETIAEHERALALTVEQRQEIDNPYVIGVPLTAQQEIFVGRADITARIEQLLLDRRGPPLLLYGQRRMGKTSLLNNLGRLLPSTVVPLFVDLQGPAAWASDHAGLLYNIARGMSDSAKRQRDITLPALSRESLQPDPFTRFDEWLDEVERSLGERAALLALDEFETLDSAFDEKRFSEMAVLGMLRHLIQHRARFKVLLAGSHSLDEVGRWASYLINAQTIHIGCLSAAEARTLIVQPVEAFVLRYQPDAVERILQLTRCHPFLVQLLCAEIVAHQNEQPPDARRFARLSDVEAAAPQALQSGSFFFADIERNQVSELEAGLLRRLAARGEGATVTGVGIESWATGADAPERVLQRLARRELVERAESGYRFQIELVRRWFARQPV